jgi:hypothetical protein
LYRARKSIFVDWLSVFKNNAHEVILLDSCRDPSKVPAGRLFEFHKSLFTLSFTVEKPLVEAYTTHDIFGEDKNRRKESNGNNEHNNMDTDERYGNLPKANLDSQGAGATHQSGKTNRTRMVANHGTAQDDVNCSR